MLAFIMDLRYNIRALKKERKNLNIAEWSSPVARRAHNPKVVGSNPASATTKNPQPMRLVGFSLFIRRLHILDFGLHLVFMTVKTAYESY
jgi:hypothetical protein